MEMSSANKNLLSTGKKSELQSKSFITVIKYTSSVFIPHVIYNNIVYIFIVYAETENIPNDGETDGDKKPAGEGNTIHSWVIITYFTNLQSF